MRMVLPVVGTTSAELPLMVNNAEGRPMLPGGLLVRLIR